MNRTESNFKPFKNRPISRIVCWVCGGGSGTLKRLRDSDGKKVDDYACLQHFDLGRPPVENSSQVYFNYEKEN